MKKALVSVLILLFVFVAAVTPAEEPGGLAAGDWQYVPLQDGTVEITRYTGEDAILAIPDTLDGMSVSRIGDRAFTNCRSLTAVTIPDSVTALGNTAFYFCPLLTDVTLPDSVVTVGAAPFCLCGSLGRITVSTGNPALTDVDGVLFSKADHRLICCPSGYPEEAYTIPPDTAIIGDQAFHGCARLARISIPDSVTAIGSGAFAACEGLAEITLPDSVAAVGANPFYLCSRLTDILVSLQHPALTVIDGALYTREDMRLVCWPCASPAEHCELPEGCTVVGDMAFYRCEALSGITLPDSVTAIGDMAFYRCEALSGITLPDGLTALGDDAFYWCERLTSLALPAALTDIGADAFTGCSALTLTVPRGSFAEQYCRDHNLQYACSEGNDG